VPQIRYKSGYKYQLADDYIHELSFSINSIIINTFISIKPPSILSIKSGYAWDGPSGPTVDTPAFMRGSLIHDALYQLIREGLLDPSYRKLADEELLRVCKADGMNWFRRGYTYSAVRWFAGNSAKVGSEIEKIHTAP